jgi:hypothetical protein
MSKFKTTNILFHLTLAISLIFICHGSIVAADEFSDYIIQSKRDIPVMDISVMLTPVSVILTPLRRKWFKEQKV